MKVKARFFSELMTALSLMMDLDENRKLYHAWRVAIVAEKDVPANIARGQNPDILCRFAPRHRRDFLARPRHTLY